MDKKRYPKDWDAISLRVREQAGNKCQQCGVPNGLLIYRNNEDSSKYVYFNPDGDLITNEGVKLDIRDGADNFAIEPTRVVLTVAHLGAPYPDGTPGDKHNKHDVRPENLAAMCQRCHLLYDMQDHIAARKRNRLKKKQQEIQANGQPPLFSHFRVQQGQD